MEDYKSQNLIYKGTSNELGEDESFANISVIQEISQYILLLLCNQCRTQLI